MIHIHDITIIRTIVKETKDWYRFKEEFNPELESCAIADEEEKKEIFIQYLMHIGKKFEKNFNDPINDLNQFEKFLFTNENYRDHILHTFRVWGLGLLLYRKIFEPTFDRQRINSDTFHFLWYLASVYHDVGYPLEKIQKIVKLMNKNFQNTGIEISINSSGNVNYLCTPEINDVLRDIFPEFSFDNFNILNKKHGELSARILIFSLQKHLAQRWSEEAKKSIKSIVLHDNENIEISINDDPLSALLVICDEMQEWGRPFSSLSKYHRNKLSHIALETGKDNFGQNLDPIQISYKYPRNAIIDETREMEKVKNFRRIKGIKIKKIV
jgi:hypothetical protein